MAETSFDAVAGSLNSNFSSATLLATLTPGTGNKQLSDDYTKYKFLLLTSMHSDHNNETCPALIPVSLAATTDWLIKGYHGEGVQIGIVNNTEISYWCAAVATGKLYGIK